MKKGKFALNLTAIAVIAFAFVVLRQPIAVLLVCGFAFLAEKDEWLNRQTTQALLLMIVYYLADLVIGWIFGGLTTFFGWVKLFKVASVMATIGSIVGVILYLALAVLSVIAVIKLLRGKDAGLPLISKIASWDFVIKEKPASSPVPPQPVYPAQAAPVQDQYYTQDQPQQPMQDQYYAPVQPQAPMQEQYYAPAQPQAPAQEQYYAPVQPPAPAQEQYYDPVQQAAPAQEQQQAEPGNQMPPAQVEAAPQASPDLCSVCSNPLHENALFCAECGTKTE